MKVSHTDVEFYGHTSDRSRIHKKMGAMPNKMGAVIKHFYTKMHTHGKEGGRRRNKRTCSKVRKKQRECVPLHDYQQPLTPALRSKRRMGNEEGHE
jgi:hypothetical protein